MEREQGEPNTFRALWHNAASRYAGQPVIVAAEDGSEFSYEDADLLVSATISFLHRYGLRQGDRVLVHADNHPEYLFLIWAALQLGVAVVPVDFSAPLHDLKSIIDEVSPSLIFCDGERQSSVADSAIPVVIFDSQLGAEQDDERAFANQIAEFIGSSLPPLPELDGSELGAILFTSGSSGKPKGVMLKQGALCRSGELMASAYGWQRGDTLLSLGALHVMSGLRNPAMAALASGTTVLVASAQRRNLAPAVAEMSLRHRATIITSVPAFLHALISEQQRWQPAMMKSVRMIMVTGAGMDQKSAQTLAGIIDTAVLNYYGLTETCGLCCYVPLQYPQQGDGILGVAIGADAEVVDEQGAVIAGEGVGELRIRSDNLMLGYLAMPELTQQVLRDGWFYTGDLVQRRSDGMLYLMGRRDDRIKSRGGEIVYPDEVARTIQQYDAVLSVSVCAVATAQQQQELIAFVVMRETQLDDRTLGARLREWMMPRLGTSQLPAHVVLCDVLPVAASGKVDRKKLVQEYLGGK